MVLGLLTFGVSICEHYEKYTIEATLIWTLMFIIGACFLRSKMRLLDQRHFITEIKAINMQNLMLTICISVLLINEVIIYQFSITKFWVKMSSGLLYCVAQMLVYNYFFLSHHRVFKKAVKS